MVKNFFKIAIRNLLKYKTYTFINIAGFAVGLASCIVILLYISYELSYDKFHDKAENIYRVTAKGKVANNEFNLAVIGPPVAKALLNDFSSIVNAVRLQGSQNMLIRTGDKNFVENNFIWADSSFFQFFTYKLLLGEPDKVLADPHTVVLTKSTALKYFGRIDVIGTILEFEDFTPYKITGVCADPPDNAHFKFDILASLESLDYDDRDIWLAHTFTTYVMLADGQNASDIEEKFPAFIEKYIGPQLQGAIGSSIEEFKNNGGLYEYKLQPLTDIHLHSKLEAELQPNGDISYVYIFSLIAFFILAIACINFMNLSTARSLTRAREIGIRKVLGSNIGQLIRQFLSESILLTAIAMIFAVVIAYLLLPFFNSIAGKDYPFTIFSHWYSIPLIFLSVLIVGTLAGIYPAIYLSSFQPVKVLKTSLTSTGKGSFLRKALVVFQFGVSIILIIGTIIVNSQLNFVQEKNLGWNKDHVLIINRAWAVENDEQAIRNELLNNPNISAYSSSWAVPGRVYNSFLVWNPETPRGTHHLFSGINVKKDYEKVFDLKVLKGRFFSDEFLSDSTAVVLNESAVKILNLGDDPVGKKITFPGNVPSEDFYLTVIGVVKDFHFESLHQKIRPLVISYLRGQPGFVSLKIAPQNVRATVDYISSVWSKFIPDKPFEYFFIDEDFARLYDNEIRTSKIFSSFSVLAIFIACLGLFGLATFTTIQKNKEIGIRKTLGASVATIVYLLSKEFSKWVLLANIIAWPVSFYFMRKWLESFEYRIEISPFSFIIAGAGALIIALSTVIYQALKAAYANPIKSLRQE